MSDTSVNSCKQLKELYTGVQSAEFGMGFPILPQMASGNGPFVIEKRGKSAKHGRSELALGPPPPVIFHNRFSIFSHGVIKAQNERRAFPDLPDLPNLPDLPKFANLADGGVMHRIWHDC